MQLRDDKAVQAFEELLLTAGTWRTGLGFWQTTDLSYQTETKVQ